MPALLGLFIGVIAAEAQPRTITNATSSLAVLEAEMSNAVAKVKAIINQPVPKYARTSAMSVSVFSPGWFHDGAVKPSFETVDVRTTQDIATFSRKKYVTSDFNPGVVFPSDQVEFNAMTKYFYIDRTLPKKRLTEPAMIEINRLYRIIGRCEREIDQVQNPPMNEPETVANDGGQKARIPSGNFLKAGIGIAVVLLLYSVYRFFR